MKAGTNMNQSIRASKVILIDESGRNYGFTPINEALYKAQEAGLDLVEVGLKEKMPVCRIMDYGKWKYEQDKKRKKNTHHKRQIKEMKFRPNTGDNDLKYRAKQTDKFLNSGNKVKLVVRFKGREQEHIYVTGKSLLEKFLSLLTAEYNIFDKVKLEDKSIILLLVPREINDNN